MPSNPPIDPFKPVSKADLAKLLGLRCSRTIDNYIRRQILPPPMRFGGRDLWHPESLQGCLQRMTGSTLAARVANGPAADNGSIFVSKTEAAEVIGLRSPKTIDNYIAAGLLPEPARIGGRSLWHRNVFYGALSKALMSQMAGPRQAGFEVEGKEVPPEEAGTAMLALVNGDEIIGGTEPLLVDENAVAAVRAGPGRNSVADDTNGLSKAHATLRKPGSRLTLAAGSEMHEPPLRDSSPVVREKQRTTQRLRQLNSVDYSVWKSETV